LARELLDCELFADVFSSMRRGFDENGGAGVALLRCACLAAEPQTWPIKLGHLILKLCSMEQSSMVSRL